LQKLRIDMAALGDIFRNDQLARAALMGDIVGPDGYLDLSAITPQMSMHHIRSVAPVANLLIFGGLLARQNDVV
jgi:hypothetical protein